MGRYRGGVVEVCYMWEFLAAIGGNTGDCGIFQGPLGG